MLVLISVKTGLYQEPSTNVVIDLRVEMALHDIFLVVPIVCACPTAWGIGNLHQTAAVEEEPCPSGFFSWFDLAFCDFWIQNTFALEFE